MVGTSICHADGCQYDAGVNTYLVVKTLHVLSAAVLLGTGAGIAFFLWMAHRSKNIEALRVVARIVIRADWLFTATAVVTQFATGLWLMHLRGLPFNSGWFAWVMALYLAVGACWIPVVVLQYRIARHAREATRFDMLPAAYHRAMGWWVALGIPAFAMVIALYAIMILKPGMGGTA
jgi:uncharacterized membrane protein